MKSILKSSKTKEVELIKVVLSNNKKTYLYLVLELPPKRLYIEGYRIVLKKFVKAVRFTDPIAVIVQYEDSLEVSDRKVYTYLYRYISEEDEVLE